MLKTRRLTSTAAIIGLAAVGISAMPRDAEAWWAYGYGPGVYAPPVVVAPPYGYAPRYYAPPPVVYAPPPGYVVRPRVWVRPHWEGPYWVRGHWY